jgi:hypothetical protein
MLQTLSGAQVDDACGVQLTRTAFRIAINRVVAGVHFPVDLVAGLVLGLTLSRYVWHMADPRARGEPWPLVVFDPVRYQQLGPLGGLHSGEDVMRAFQVAHSAVPSVNTTPPAALLAPAWAEMWRAAAQEWQEVHHGA